MSNAHCSRNNFVCSICSSSPVEADRLSAPFGDVAVLEAELSVVIEGMRPFCFMSVDFEGSIPLLDYRTSSFFSVFPNSRSEVPWLMLGVESGARMVTQP